MGPMFHPGFAQRRREVRPGSMLRVLGRVYWDELSGVRTRTALWANLRWCQPFCCLSPCTSPFPLRGLNGAAVGAKCDLRTLVRVMVRAA